MVNPMNGFYDLIVAQGQTTARRETQRNNAARLAFSQHKMESSGIGLVEIAEPIFFDIVFLDEPLFTTGATVISRPSGGAIPMGSAGVYQWERNPKGHYTGAYVYLSVWQNDNLFGESAGVRMSHHLLFQGMGYKDLGQNVTAEAQMLEPRTVGFGV